MIPPRLKLERQIAHWTEVEKDTSLPTIQRNVARATLVRLKMQLLSLDLKGE